MYNLILATEKYYYYCNEDEHVKMYDENKKCVAKGELAINNMLFELELIDEGSLECKFRDDDRLIRFIAEYW